MEHSYMPVKDDGLALLQIGPVPSHYRYLPALTLLFPLEVPLCLSPCIAV